jgi:hypothetical protein
VILDCLSFPFEGQKKSINSKLTYVLLVGFSSVPSCGATLLHGKGEVCFWSLLSVTIVGKICITNPGILDV